MPSFARTPTDQHTRTEQHRFSTHAQKYAKQLRQEEDYRGKSGEALLYKKVRLLDVDDLYATLSLAR